jgi:tellurite resistance protein
MIYDGAVPHPQVMFMLRLLAAVSWSDGELSEDEAAKLDRLINAADLDDAE